MICGGFNENPLTRGSNKCFILGESQPITMEHERAYPASISISKDKVSHFQARGVEINFELQVHATIY